MHTEGRESELLIALAQTRNELARERENRWNMEKERGEVNEVLKTEMARADAAESERDALRADVKRLRERDDAARAILSQLRAALEDDTTFLGAVLRVEMDKWLGAALASGGDRP